jgi:hypothetical protein
MKSNLYPSFNEVFWTLTLIYFDLFYTCLPPKNFHLVVLDWLFNDLQLMKLSFDLSSLVGIPSAIAYIATILLMVLITVTFVEFRIHTMYWSHPCFYLLSCWSTCLFFSSVSFQMLYCLLQFCLCFTWWFLNIRFLWCFFETVLFLLQEVKAVLYFLLELIILPLYCCLIFLVLSQIKNNTAWCSDLNRSSWLSLKANFPSSLAKESY